MISKDEYFIEFIEDRNLGKESIEIYKYALIAYSQFNSLKLGELVDEADKEEEERIRTKKRKIVKRLKDFRKHLIQKEYEVNTIKDYFIKIKTFYRHFGIEIPYIPPVQLKNNKFERYDDIPTKKHIETALEAINNLRNKAIILFMSSSGSARNETISLTIGDFIKATKDYHHYDEIKPVLKELEKQKDVVPLFEMVRSKTNYPYYTCCSPEAVKMIIKYLKTRKNLENDEKLFDINGKYFITMFQRINDKLGWGKVNNSNFFHSHALRKFNATAIEDSGLANTLQGRKPDSITEAYFKKNPERIREKYIKNLPKLTIHETEVNILDDEGYKRLNKIENENKELKRKLEAYEADQKVIKDSLREYLNELK